MIFTVLKYVPLLIISLIVLVGCSDSKERLKGQRERLLDQKPPLEADPDGQNIEIKLTSPVSITEWAQVDMNPTHIKPHAKMPSNDFKTIWKKSIGAADCSSGFLLVPPIVKDNMIYTLDSYGLITGLDATSGDKRWSYQIKTSLSQGCLGGGIAIEHNRIFAAFSSADIIALDAQTGEEIWRTNIVHPIRSSITVKDNQLYIITKSNRIFSLDARTGNILWQKESAEGACSFLGGGAVAVDRKIVIVPYSSGEIASLKTENGHSLWSEALTSTAVTRSLAFLSHIKASPIIDKDMVFVTSPNGRFMALEFKTGRVIWDKPFGSFQTPVVNNNYIFLITTRNELICVLRETGMVVWVYRLPRYQDQEKKNPIKLSGPLLINNHLLVTSSIGEAYFINALTGTLAYAYENFYATNLSPVCANQHLYILTNTGTLVALQ